MFDWRFAQKVDTALEARSHSNEPKSIEVPAQPHKLYQVHQKLHKTVFLQLESRIEKHPNLG